MTLKLGIWLLCIGVIMVLFTSNLFISKSEKERLTNALSNNANSETDLQHESYARLNLRIRRIAKISVAIGALLILIGFLLN
jgi:uncharacterized membrane protein